jgi:uncharacterized membrane protein
MTPSIKPTKPSSVKSTSAAILRNLAWGVMLLFALLLFTIASRYLTFDPEVYFPEQRAVYIAYTFGIVSHIAGSMLALIIGPFQFLPVLRRGRSLKVHRWLGRIYLAGVLVGGLSGLYMAFLAYGGLVAKLGFATLALLWLFSAVMAYQHIRHKEIQQHKEWMIRNYALTFGAVTLRLWLGVFQAVGLEFITSYMIVAWLAWIPNLLVAEWMIRRKQLASVAPSKQV